MHRGFLSSKLPTAIIASVAGLFATHTMAYAGEADVSALSDKTTAPNTSHQFQLGGSNKENIYADLNRVRDWGLIIRQFKELALSLYLEGTRTKLSPEDGSDLNSPNEIPKSTNLDYSKCLPPRIEWIAYYLNSMEPLTQFIQVRMKASEAGKISLFVPKGTSTELVPVRAQIRATMCKLQGDLDSLNDIFNEETIPNKQVVDVSRKIYDDVADYEVLRKRFYEVIRKAQKQGITAYEPMPPVSQN